MGRPSKLTMLILGLFKFLLPSGTLSRSGKNHLLIGALSIWKHKGTGRSIRNIIDVAHCGSGLWRAGFHASTVATPVTGGTNPSHSTFM